MEINVIEQASQWDGHTVDALLVVDEVLKAADVAKGTKSLSIVLTDDNHIRVLNAQFRDKDKPTNVLSFPSDEAGEWGDVILSYETIEREAKQQDKLFDHHVAHLMVHGVLHLLGYDHQDNTQAEKMEALEIDILEQLGIESPYET